uniref:Hda110 n=1 Tax=Arundo donax TaxID=35708 RepID=A0A0A9DTV5_ARUDO
MILSSEKEDWKLNFQYKRTSILFQAFDNSCLLSTSWLFL